MSTDRFLTRFATIADLEFVQQDRYIPTEVVKRKIEAQEVIVAEAKGIRKRLD